MNPKKTAVEKTTEVLAISCPSCGSLWKVKREWVGRRVRCRRCRQQLFVQAESMFPAPPRERRKHPRYDADYQRTLALAHLADGEVLGGVVKDISEDGVRIAGQTAGLRVDDEITLTLLGPMIPPTNFQCAVRHIDPDGKSWGASILLTEAGV